MSNQKCVLLTGGLGYIGSHTCVALERVGYRTVILDNLSNSSLSVLDDISVIIGRKPEFHEIDLRDARTLGRLFSTTKFDAVIHFAGRKAVGESVALPFEYYDNNVSGSLCLYEAMERAGIRNIIFSSSATVYDSSNEAAYREEFRLGTTNPYGTTKLVNELLLKDLSISKNWKSIALRYFNPIGAHESGLIGERPNGIPNNLLPYVLDVAIGKRVSISVFGDDYDTPDGTGVRDYVHVCDLSEAHVASLEYLFSIGTTTNQGYFDAFNVGTGTGVSVLEIIDMASSTVQRELPFSIVSRRPGDIASAVADTSKISKVIGWKASRSVLEGVRSGWNFVTNNQ